MRFNLFQTSIAAAALLAAASVHAEPLNYNVVSFSERVSSTVANDLMSVNLLIRESSSDRQNASNSVTKRLNAVQAQLKNSAFKVELSNRYVQPEYNNQGKIRGWVDSAYVQVQSKDFVALSKAVAQVQNDAMVQDLRFSVSPEKRHETVNELSKQALKNFRSRAKVLSETLGFSDYKIVNINIDSSFNTSYAAPAMMKTMALRSAMDASSAPEMDVSNPGSEEISQTVNGSIQM
ncbi:MAG: SIMPL domain-containing protein [Neisseria sp.]|nr:SIMPL domain-containing protein [Neisseria sp.]